MSKRNPTILDVAGAAGVSTATVSRALNGGRIAPHTQRKVETAITALGYRRNKLARGLVTGKTGVIGVVIPDIAGPLYAQMARGIEDVLETQGMHFMLVTGNRDPEQERQAIELLLERQVEALILIGSGLQHDPLEETLKGGPATVLMQREGSKERFATISLANFDGAFAATSYFIAKGHKNIAHIAGIRRGGEERLRGYRQAMKNADLPVGPVIQGGFTEQSGYHDAAQLLQYKDVTAVFCANDRIALGLYRYCKTQGLQIPDDLSIIGFDDLPWVAYLDPPLTTIRQPAREMGRIAATQALAMLSGNTPPQNTPITAELIERSSVKTLTIR